MTTLTQGQNAGEFMVSEGNGHISRETVTLASGQNLKAGAVLGKVTASGEYAEYDPTATDGSESAVAVLYDNTDASSAAQSCVAIARDAEVAGAALQWFTGASAGQIATGEAELAGAGIIVR